MNSLNNRVFLNSVEIQMVHIRLRPPCFQLFFKFCKLILKITVALDNNSATFVFLVGFLWIYPKVSLLLYCMCAKRIKFLMTRLSVCGLGVSCNEMSDPTKQFAPIRRLMLHFLCIIGGAFNVLPVLCLN